MHQDHRRTVVADLRDHRFVVGQPHAVQRGWLPVTRLDQHPIDHRQRVHDPRIEDRGDGRRFIERSGFQRVKGLIRY